MTWYKSLKSSYESYNLIEKYKIKYVGYQENVFEIKYTKINNALILHLMYSIDFK